MQVPADPRIAGLVDQLVADTVPGGRGIAAWLALLRLTPRSTAGWRSTWLSKRV